VRGLAVCAFTAAGHDSPQAVAEQAAGCLPETLAVLGGRRDPWTRRIRPPSVRTFARVFERIDAEAFNAALYGCLAALPADPPDALPAVTRHEREKRRAARAAASPGLPGLLEQAAADGKTVRGAVRPDGSQVHLLSLFDVTTGCVRAQREIPAKANEIPELAPAIAHLDLIGTVVTADALAGPDGDFADATWTGEGKGHGRRERRSIRTAPAAGIAWPHAAQVLRIRRDSGPARGPWTHKEIAYGITSLPEDLAGPAHLAVYARNHWAIEVRHEVALRE